MSEFNVADLAGASQQEVARQMSVCNACRYCEGLCAVFPAMEMRRDFGEGDVDYLSNLCHNCGACYYACQYVPPHEFAINVPVAMAALREETYARYAWPRLASPLFERNGLWVSLAAAASVAVFLLVFVTLGAGGDLWQRHVGAGAFYALLPHGAMVVIFGAVFLYVILAMTMSVRRFWRASDSPADVERGSVRQALHDALTLRYLDGGGNGCMNAGERPRDRRRLFHHLTASGFLLCFAATSSGTIFHYLGWEAPYPWWNPTVILGFVGGLGLIAGPIGLLKARGERAGAITNDTGTGMGTTFLWMLLLTSVSGLLLLFLRSTPAMNILLAIHLGIVFALFLSLPYGKFVHGIYRFASLVRYAHERRANAS